MNVRPAIVSVPIRSAPVFAAIVKSTAPLPLPLAPEVIINHVALLPAVHAQPAIVVTITVVPVPPAAPIDWLDGAIVYVHAGGGAAACVTVNVWPAIVRVPARPAPVLAATLNVTDPFPFPIAPALHTATGTDDDEEDK